MEDTHLADKTLHDAFIDELYVAPEHRSRAFALFEALLALLDQARELQKGGLPVKVASFGRRGGTFSHTTCQGPSRSK